MVHAVDHVDVPKPAGLGIARCTVEPERGGLSSALPTSTSVMRTVPCGRQLVHSGLRRRALSGRSDNHSRGLLVFKRLAEPPLLQPAPPAVVRRCTATLVPPRCGVGS